MGVRNFEELAAYQLSRDLRDKVVALTSTVPLSRDRDLCHDLRRAVRSAPSNIAEGFGRWHTREFMRFLAIARSSLMEAQNHLGEIRTIGAAPVGMLDECDTLARRAIAAITGLMRSLA
jgi:four helix bundle protein